MSLIERLGAHGARFPDSLVHGAVEAIWQGLAPAPAGPVPGRRRGAA